MKINKNSWHYKLWSNGIGRYGKTIPTQTDLCRYCHRIFWVCLLYVLMAFAFVYIIGAVGYLIFYLGLFLHTLLTLGIIGAVVVGGTLVYLYICWFDNKESAEPTTLVGKYAQASKDKVCPLIEFEE